MLLFSRVFVLITLFVLSVVAAPPCDLTIGRLKYQGGGDWYANPTSLPNLINAARKQTRINICPEEKSIEITDPDLYSYPFLYMTGHGNVRFSDEEVLRLREYLMRGGFLFADDNYGMDVSFRREMKRVFPELTLMELPFTHLIYHCFYDFPQGLPKIHKHDGGPAQGLGLFHQGRLMVFYSFSADLGDGWEDTEVHNDPPEKHEAALRMGINVLTYFLTE